MGATDIVSTVTITVVPNSTEQTPLVTNTLKVVAAANTPVGKLIVLPSPTIGVPMFTSPVLFLRLD